jgi:hypothetical protein
MPAIVTIDQVKDNLGLVGTTSFDGRLTRDLEIAEEAVLEYVKQRHGDDDEVAEWSDTVDSWDDQTAPWRVVGAIIKLACHLFAATGDEHPDDAPVTEPNELPRDVTALLSRFRDPGMA